MLSIFAVGTMSFVDTADAAKWKKYNSGKFKDEYPAYGHTKTGTFKSFTKGNNQLYVNVYVYKSGKNSNTKILQSKTTFTKKNGIMKVVTNDYGWKEKKTEQFKTSLGVKTVYKAYIKGLIRFNSIPPSKAAFDTRTINMGGQSVKSYAIKYDTNYIHIFFHYNGQEFSSQSIKKEKNTVTMKQYNHNRKVIAQDVFKSTKSINTIYREVIADYLSYDYT